MSRWAWTARRLVARCLLAVLVVPAGAGFASSAAAAAGSSAAATADRGPEYAAVSAAMSARAAMTSVSGGSAAEADAAAVSAGDALDLFYGRTMTADAWSAYDRARFSSEILSLGLKNAYNQWLAIADLRAAYYRATGRLEPGGVTVYPSGASAVIHVLDLALWARERALLWLLGLQALRPYPRFGDLGYGDPGNYIGSTPQGNAITPSAVGALIDQLPLPSALFAGDRIFLMPYRLPQEYALTDVYGPGIRIWLGATATTDLRHVLYHELGHAVHFRFGGLDTTSTGQPLSAFWQQYLQIRGLAWEDPTQVPWAERTIECFAEDFAYAFRAPGDVLGYEAACPPPTAKQVSELDAFWRNLPDAGTASPYQQAQWVQWQSPWPSVLFGGFRARLFTDRTSVGVRLSLAAQAIGGPYTVQAPDAPVPLATLRPGAQWSDTVAVPQGSSVEIDADVQEGSSTLTLTSLYVYSNPAFVPEPQISGVFPDTIDSWARAAIAAAVRAGIVGGYPDGEFRPNGAVTRAEFARMLAAGLPGRPYLRALAAARFSDVHTGFWAEPFIATVGLDLPGTVPDGPFRPNRPVLRQEAVAWTAKAYGSIPLSPTTAAAVLATYPDGAQVSRADAPWYAAALMAGLVGGTAAGGGLRPLAPLSRAEAAVLVLRARQISQAQVRGG